MNKAQARRRGKQYERFIALDLGGRRIGLLGQEDVQFELISAECKEREKLPAFLKKCLAQAVDNCEEDKLPVVFLHEHNVSHEFDIVVMFYVDWKDMFFEYRTTKERGD